MNLFRLQTFALFAVLASTSSACATITGKSNRVLRLHTTPDYAKAVINGQKEYGANSTVELEGMGPYTIEFKKDGYLSQKVILDPELNLYFFGNLAFGPLFPVGMVIDVVTGAIHTVKAPDIRVELRPVLVDKAVAPPVIERKVIAVMPVEVAKSATIAESLADGLTDQLRVSLASRGLRVIDRGEQERALAEIIEDEKTRSYDECTDESCQIPLGKALAASHILRTSLSRFGKMCAMTAELIALRESVTVEANTARGSCSEEGLLDTATELIDGIE
jgi:TolB-like protein